ncbi:MAG: LamG-like jellyroll fold domain-containing protein [Candidatus Zipacnadales bacterium]
MFTDLQLARLRQTTVVLWFRPVDDEGPARLLYLPGEWDVIFSNSRVTLKVESGNKDYHFVMDRNASAVKLDEWTFLSIAADFGKGTGTMYMGTRVHPPVRITTWEGLPPPRGGRGELQIGNLGGIRPFRGQIDNVRVFGATLNDQEIAAVYTADVNDTKTLKDYAVARRGDNLPGLRYSDVCLSSRWVRENALEAIHAFGANRIVWVYTQDAQFVSQIHEHGATIQGTINSVTRVDDLSAYAVNLDGVPLVAPWMANFNPKDPVKWGCPNQLAYRNATIQAAKQALDAGVDWMQFDDWSLLASCHNWGGGCMCERCMERFREYLAALPADRLREAGIESLDGFDYRTFLAQAHGITDAATYMEKRNGLPTTHLFTDWQRRSVRAWFDDLRSVMDKHAGRRVPLSINANLQDPSQERNFIADQVDFYLGETWSSELVDLAICAKAAEALGIHQIVSPFPHRVGDTRLAMAATYALGEFFWSRGTSGWDLTARSATSGPSRSMVTCSTLCARIPPCSMDSSAPA